MCGDPLAPLVSIVLPTHNGERHIGEAIESCVGQTYRNLELIVVEDGSTDGTLGVVKRYLERDGRLRLLRHECNRKLPAALNTGFASAAGRYLTWISDDNVLETIPCREDRFDVVFAVETIEHSPNMQAAVQELVRVTRPGGWVVIVHKKANAMGPTIPTSWMREPPAACMSRWLRRDCNRVTVEPVPCEDRLPPRRPHGRVERTEAIARSGDRDPKALTTHVLGPSLHRWFLGACPLT